MHVCLLGAFRSARLIETDTLKNGGLSSNRSYAASGAHVHADLLSAFPVLFENFCINDTMNLFFLNTHQPTVDFVELLGCGCFPDQQSRAFHPETPLMRRDS